MSRLALSTEFVSFLGIALNKGDEEDIMNVLVQLSFVHEVPKKAHLL